MSMNRRRFLQACGASAAVSIAPTRVKAASAPHVVVIGGGFAGATAAKYLRMWSDRTIDVTLVDPNASHTSCVLSNLVLNRRITLKELKMDYGSLSSFYGVNVVRDRANKVDGAGKRVRLKEGGWLNYDHLVIATGINMINPPSIDYKLTPHAWIAGGQTNRLASLLNKVGPDSTVIMTIPKSPYRCPPGPYERACLIADIIKRKGLEGSARLQVLDANSSIQAEKHTFENAFNNLYGNIVEYITGVEVEDVISTEGRVVTRTADYVGDVVNIIPQQRAMGFIRNAGLTGDGLWASVDPLTYASTVSGFDGVHIIGDSQATGQPKSAHMANAQAKVCVDAIIRSLAGVPNDDPERVANVTTASACYSPITYDQASWLSAVFAYNTESGQMALTHLGEADRWSTGNYRQMFGWASNLFTDSFH